MLLKLRIEALSRNRNSKDDIFEDMLGEFPSEFSFLIQDNSMRQNRTHHPFDVIGKDIFAAAQCSEAALILTFVDSHLFELTACG